MELRGIRVWDGERDLGTCDVAWDGDRIRSVMPAGHDRFPGCSLLPGIVDTHVHIVQYAGQRPVDERAWALTAEPVEQMLHAAAIAQRALRFGVTGLRDLGAFEPPVAIRHSFDAGIWEGPRLAAFGHLTMTAGHGDLMWPAAVHDRPPTADGPDACRRQVRLYARQGVDGIKVFTSGGVMSLGDRSAWRNYTMSELEAIVDEAHALGLPVAAHAHSEAGIRAALDAGVDSLEHATLIPDEEARRARDMGVTIAPTLVVLDRTVRGDLEVPEESLAKARSLYGRRGACLRAAAGLGVRFVLGTDGGSSRLPIGSQFEEMEAMRDQLGISDEEVLRGATSRAAETAGLGTQVGRIVAGYAADFLVVRGRPWERLEDVRPASQVAVVSRGALRHGTWPIGTGEGEAEASAQAPARGRGSLS